MKTNQTIETPTNEISTEPRDYSQPSSAQIDDIRKRLAELPSDVIERVHHLLEHDTVDAAASLLWKAGAGFTSAELYEFRKTLFPPNSLVDPYTAGPPVLCVMPASTSASSSAVPLQSELRASADAHIGSEPSSSSTGQPASDVGSPGSDLRPLVSGNSLLSDLRDLISRHVVLPDMAAETLALWVVHTCAFTLRQVTTYIGVVSPEKRCGKTTLLELLGFLAHEAVTAANISPSALFRVIEEARPTLIIDEADTFLQTRDEMAGILNAGYRKSNSYVLRVDESKARKQERAHDSSGVLAAAPGLARYSCWCPKVMAAIGRLPDTLADRCIVITMQRKMPGEKCGRLRQFDPTELRRRCADFVQQHSDAIANAEPQIPAALNDRAADIWEPLFVIADLAGGDWPALARKAAQKLSGSYDDEMTLIAYFLSDLRNWMLLKKLDRILSRDVVATFNPCHTRPWEDLRRGREINEWWLSRQMNALGIHSKYLRFGETVGRGYILPDIEAACRRYVPNPDTAPTSPG